MDACEVTLTDHELSDEEILCISHLVAAANSFSRTFHAVPEGNTTKFMQGIIALAELVNKDAACLITEE